MSNKHFTLWSVGLLTLTATITTSFRTPKISKDEATKIAVDFIVRNGYTNAPPDTTVKKLDYEIMVDVDGPEEALKRRHNTLLANKYTIEQVRKGWAVVFEQAGHHTLRTYKNGIITNKQKFGRGLLISKDGLKVKMINPDVLLLDVD